LSVGTIGEGSQVHEQLGWWRGKKP